MTQLHKGQPVWVLIDQRGNPAKIEGTLMSNLRVHRVNKVSGYDIEICNNHSHHPSGLYFINKKHVRPRYDDRHEPGEWDDELFNPTKEKEYVLS